MSASTVLDDSMDRPGDDRFSALLAAIRDGCEEASQTLVEEYGSHILRAVRRRMNRRSRERYDSEDFAQSVWASFFGHLSIVSRFNTSGELATYLARMASHKVIDAGRKKSVRSEVNLPDSADTLESPQDRRRQYAEPTPSQVAVAKERWDCLNKDEDEFHRRLLRMRRAGATQQEIADALGVSERHVRRVLDRLSKKSRSDQPGRLSGDHEQPDASDGTGGDITPPEA